MKTARILIPAEFVTVVKETKKATLLKITFVDSKDKIERTIQFWTPDSCFDVINNGYSIKKSIIESNAYIGVAELFATFDDKVIVENVFNFGVIIDATPEKREILTEGGYNWDGDGLKVSNRSIESRENGALPASYFKLPAGFVAGKFTSMEWHHTGSKFAQTYHYDSCIINEFAQSNEGRLLIAAYKLFKKNSL